MKIEKNKDLVEYNFYKTKTKTKYFVELKKRQDLVDVFKWIKKNKIKKYTIIGAGANIIFVDNIYNGLVIKIDNNNIDWDKKKNIVNVGSGVIWDSFLQKVQDRIEKEKKKISCDIQTLSAIPGTVGAGVYGNIGAFGSEIKKYVYSVEYYDIKKEEFKIIRNRDLNFSYRNSFFKKNKDKYIIFSVIFDFTTKFKSEMDEKYSDEEYFSFEHFVKKHNLGKIKKTEIRKNIKKIRKNIYPDVKKFPNVGSTFKNTEVTKTQFKFIVKKFPEIPNWELDNDKIKIPTAYIFDKILKLNGMKFGNIKVHETRPLFFMNMGEATGIEFFKLCEKIKKDALKKIKVKLETEVIFIK